MSRRRRSSRSSSRSVFIGFLVVVALAAIGLAFGLETAQEFAATILGVEMPSPMPTGVTPQALTEAGDEPPPVVVERGEGVLYSVYFTDPQYPDEAPHVGGIDQHLVDLIDGAQYTIDIAFFEFDLQSVSDALLAAQRRGVQVRIVYDDEHTEDLPQFEQLLDAGLPATPDERGAYMHNKFAVIDGQIVWTGSWNMTDNGTYRNNNNVIVISSPELAANYTAEFEEMFGGAFGPTSPANTPYPALTIGDLRLENYFSPEDGVTPRIVSEIARANTSIHFMAFAFTDDDIGAAMRDRMTSGVQVAGIFETRSASTEYSECGSLLQAGADVRLDGNPYTFHHKVIIIDGETVITGSFNFSRNAATDNDENLLIIHSPDIAAAYEAEFNRRMAESQPLTGDTCRTD